MSKKEQQDIRGYYEYLRAAVEGEYAVGWDDYHNCPIADRMEAVNGE